MSVAQIPAERTLLFLWCSTSLQDYTRQRGDLERDAARLERAVRIARSGRGVVLRAPPEALRALGGSGSHRDPIAGRKGP